MKSKLLTVFLASALSTIGLCSTISHASEKNEFFIQSNVQSHIYDQPVAKVTTVNITSSTYSNKIYSFEELSSQPLYFLSSSTRSEYASTKKYKKNHLFEFATLFNDKLQQIIAFFEFTRSSKHNNYMNSDKPNDNTSIDLSSDCKTNKF